MKKINVFIYGCGVMGRRVAAVLLDKQTFEVVGAVDIDPKLVGKDLGDILEAPRKTQIQIEAQAKKLFSQKTAQAVVLATTSCLEGIMPQLKEAIQAGLNVISTCEELSYPWHSQPELAQKIDRMAKKHGVTVVGTGINPGYLMDTLPLVLTAPCITVDSIKVTRMMNSAKRRLPFQSKVGTGMSTKEFKEKINKKVITGHVGLLESIHAIASGLGWKLDEAVEQPPKPVLAEHEIKTGLGRVAPGRVIGLTSLAHAKKDGKTVITLEFCAHAAVKEEYDEIVIDGTPRIHERIVGGVNGDTGTVAVTVNTIPRAVEASPGLKIMKDLAPPTATL